MPNRILTIKEIKYKIEELLNEVCKNDPPKLNKKVRTMIKRLIGI